VLYEFKAPIPGYLNVELRKAAKAALEEHAAGLSADQIKTYLEAGFRTYML
jgi:hypothetical protein